MSRETSTHKLERLRRTLPHEVVRFVDWAAGELDQLITKQALDIGLQLPDAQAVAGEIVQSAVQRMAIAVNTAKRRKP